MSINEDLMLFLIYFKINRRVKLHYKDARPGFYKFSTEIKKIKPNRNKTKQKIKK